MASLAEHDAERAARFKALLAHPRYAGHPDLVHKPMVGRWLMVAYGNGEALEFNLEGCRPHGWQDREPGHALILKYIRRRRTARQALVAANEQAIGCKRSHVALYDCFGALIYDGPVLDANGYAIDVAPVQRLAA